MMMATDEELLKMSEAEYKRYLHIQKLKKKLELKRKIKTQYQKTNLAKQAMSALKALDYQPSIDISNKGRLALLKNMVNGPKVKMLEKKSHFFR